MQRKALKQNTKETTPNTPNLLKTRTVSKWSDVIKFNLYQVFGTRSCDMYYLIRCLLAVPAVAPSLEMNQPHLDEAVSIQEEMIMRLSHSHQLYRNNNNTFYIILEKAVRGTFYEASIKPLQGTRDVRVSYLTLIAHHEGKDKWVVIIRDAKSYVGERKWNGTTIHTHQSHV